MSLMNVDEVAEFLGVTNARVQRLERESLLIAKEMDEQGQPMFDAEQVKQYKVFAERLGGL